MEPVVALWHVSFGGWRVIRKEESKNTRVEEECRNAVKFCMHL